VRGTTCGKGKIFYFTGSSPALRPAQSHVRWVFFHRGKRSEREGDDSPQFSAEAKIGGAVPLLPHTSSALPSEHPLSLIASEKFAPPVSRSQPSFGVCLCKEAARICSGVRYQHRPDSFCYVLALEFNAAWLILLCPGVGTQRCRAHFVMSWR
jgi:hypothetical protein